MASPKNLPTPGASVGVWGGMVNAAFDQVDDDLDAGAAATAVVADDLADLAVVVAAKPTTAYVDDAVADGLAGVDGRIHIANTAPPATALAWIRRKGTPVLESDPNLAWMVYLDDQLSAIADGTTVASVPGQYGSLSSSVTLTQSVDANRPTVFATTIGGVSRKVLRGIAANSTTMAGSIASPITGPSTWLAVLRVAPTSQGRYLITGVNASPHRTVGVNASNRLTAYTSDGNVPTSTSITDVWRVVAITYDPTDGGVRVYDHKLTTPATGTIPDATTGIDTMTSIRLFRNAGTSSVYADAQIAAMALVLDDLDEQTVGDYITQLAARYNLSPAA